MFQYLSHFLILQKPDHCKTVKVHPFPQHYLHNYNAAAAICGLILIIPFEIQLICFCSIHVAGRDALCPTPHPHSPISYWNTTHKRPRWAQKDRSHLITTRLHYFLVNARLLCMCLFTLPLRNSSATKWVTPKGVHRQKASPCFSLLSNIANGSGNLKRPV